MFTYQTGLAHAYKIVKVVGLNAYSCLYVEKDSKFGFTERSCTCHNYGEHRPGFPGVYLSYKNLMTHIEKHKAVPGLYEFMDYNIGCYIQCQDCSGKGCTSCSSGLLFPIAAAHKEIILENYLDI